MARSTSLIAAAVAAAGLLMPMTAAAAQGAFTPGAPGGGDPYFPDMGNGGYDAQHYSLSLAYDSGTGGIDAHARIDARATQNLSSFDLDFLGPPKIGGAHRHGGRAPVPR